MSQGSSASPKSRLVFHLQHLLPLASVVLVCWGLFREDQFRQEVFLHGVDARAAVERCETFRHGPQLLLRYWVDARAVTNWVKVSGKFAERFKEGVPPSAEISIKHPKGRDRPVVIPTDPSYGNGVNYFIPVILGLLIVISYGGKLEQKRE